MLIFDPDIAEIVNQTRNSADCAGDAAFPLQTQRRAVAVGA